MFWNATEFFFVLFPPMTFLAEDGAKQSVKDPSIERAVDPQPRSQKNVQLLHFAPIDFAGSGGGSGGGGSSGSGGVRFRL